MMSYIDMKALDWVFDNWFPQAHHRRMVQSLTVEDVCYQLSLRFFPKRMLQLMGEA